MSAPASSPRAGMLLVASPELSDPNFVDAVVLLLDVNEDGALGVILNRPSVVPVSDVLDAWSDVVAEPEVLFRGGPVGPDGALGVALLIPGRDAKPLGFRPLDDAPESLAALGLIDLDAPAPLLVDTLAGLRIFAGYAGWGADQLQDEISRGDWYVVPAEQADVFGEDSTDLWREVLRRQPGNLAWHATRPVDPELN